MTRSASTLGYSKPKSFPRNTINIESPLVTSYESSSLPRIKASSTSSSPPRIKSPTSSTNSTVGTNFRSRSSSIDYELNDLFCSIVDDLCAIFVDARQSGLNEQQTVEILLVYFNHRNQDPTQIFEWLQNKTHKYKYTTLLGYFYDQGIGTIRNQRKAYCLYLSAAKKDYSVAQDLLEYFPMPVA
ncbi:5582_t:CDS:2 [Diversispora eburnea]|uniref:5582_t:CDS:1 n=1 Tax=Diversispora eburnea TaxID=1213867 RepID=A0A9N8VCR1_9GLOM|nr:5582_t:CDS:2 [Diversispora eburnea]